MKVKDFSNKIGLTSSKIRFYDRADIIQGQRDGENNYRSFNTLDALTIYNAQMLRSFNIKVQDIRSAQNEDLDHLNIRVSHQIDDLERTLKEQEMRLIRLKEMKAYFDTIGQHNSTLLYHVLEDSYNVWTFGDDSPECTQKIVKTLADVMPFSYICIKISKESVLRKDTPLKVSIGLGILRSNMEKLGLDFSRCIKKDKKRPIIQLLIETENPFTLSIKDLEPLFIELKKKDMEFCHDLLGRIYISYKKDGKTVHGLGLSYPV